MLFSRDIIFVVIRLTAPITYISPTTKQKQKQMKCTYHFVWRKLDSLFFPFRFWHCTQYKYVVDCEAKMTPHTVEKERKKNDEIKSREISLCSYLYSFEWFFWSVCRSIFVTLSFSAHARAVHELRKTHVFYRSPMCQLCICSVHLIFTKMVFPFAKGKTRHPTRSREMQTWMIIIWKEKKFTCVVVMKQF